MIVKHNSCALPVIASPLTGLSLSERRLGTSRVVSFARVCLAVVVALFSTFAHAQIFKADNNLDLSGTGSWVGGVVPPTSTGTAVWDNRVSAGNTVNTWSSGALNWRRITILDPGADVEINFTVNNSKPTFGGIDMSQATRDLTFRNTATSAYQTAISGTLNVASGRKLSLLSSVNSQWGSSSIVGSGTIYTNQNLTVFDSGAIITMTNGVLQADKGLTVGSSGSSAFNQSGGIVNIANASSSLTASATYKLSGGTLNIGSNFSILSDGKVNTLNVTAGAVNQTGGAFEIGSGTAANGLGRYIQSGDSTVVTNIFRMFGLSSFQMNGGSFTANSWDMLASNAGNTAQLTLAGGTSTLPAFPTSRGAGAYADITFDGGTLRPATASATYMQGLNHAYLTGNGALIDVPSGRDITIAQSMEDAAGKKGLLVKTGSGTLTLSGSNSYTGSTTVSLGQLTLGGANALGTGTATVGGGVLNLGSYASSVGGFTITSGSLIGTGTLTATNGYALQGGAVNAVLGNGAITVSTGTTALGSGGRFNSGSGLTISSGQLTLGGNETVASYSQSGGTLGGSGTVTAATYALSGGSVTANLGAGSITASSGTTTLSGAAAATSITINGGSLVLGASSRLASTGTVSISSGSLDTTSSGYSNSFNSFTLSGGSLLGNGTVTSASGYALQGGTLNAVLGSGAITVSTGTTSLGSGGRFNSASGLTISSGQLTLGGNESVASFALTGGVLDGSGNTLTSGSAYNVQSGSVLAKLGGSVGLTKSTAGTVTLSASNTYTGATQVTEGTLVVNAANAISSSSPITLGGNTTRGYLQIDAPLTISSLTFTGSGGDVNNSQSVATFSATSGTATITVLGGSNTFHAAATLISPTLLNVQDGASFTFHNNISGSATFTKQGLGTLNIVGDNDGYSGSFLITGGRVNIGAGMSQIGTGTTTLSGGATIDLGGQAFTDKIIVLSGTILDAGGTATTTTISGAATISGSAAGTYTVISAGNATFQSAVGNGSSQVNVDVSDTNGGGGQAVFNSPIGSRGNIVVYRGGLATFNGDVAGTTTIHGTGTFNGAYNSQANVQDGGSATFAGTTGTSSYIEIAAGGSATFSSAVSGTVNVVGGAATFTGMSSLPGILKTSSSSVATLSDMSAAVASAIHNDGQLVVNRMSGNQTISGAIDGTGSLVKQGAGLLALAGNNSYSGLTTISGGTLSVGNGGGSGSLAGNVLNNATLAFHRSDATTYAGSISGSGLVRLLSGLLTLSGSSSYSGGTWVDGGTLRAGNGNAFGTNGITLGSGATLDLTGFTVANTITNNGGTILGGVLTGTMTATSNTTIDSDLGSGASLVVGNGKTVTFGDGATVNSGASINTSNSGMVRVSRATNTPLLLAAQISGSGGLTVDSGVVNLSGANTYTGLTQVSGSDSVLKVNGSVAGDVQIDAGAILGGSGAVAGVLSGAGLVSPGNSPGILTASQFDPFGGLGAAFEFTGLTPNYSSPTGSLNDVLRLTDSTPFTGNLSLTGSNVIDVYFNASSIASGDVFEGGFFTGLSAANLLTAVKDATFHFWVKDTSGSLFFNGAQYSSFTTLAGSGITGVIVQTANVTRTFAGSEVVNGSVTQFVIIPEPDTIIFAGIGIAMAGWSLWKRRRSAHK